MMFMVALGEQDAKNAVNGEDGQGRFQTRIVLKEE
jgi:hypothetical protein